MKNTYLIKTLKKIADFRNWSIDAALNQTGKTTNIDPELCKYSKKYIEAIQLSNVMNNSIYFLDYCKIKTNFSKNEFTHLEVNEAGYMTINALEKKNHVIFEGPRGISHKTSQMAAYVLYLIMFRDSKILIENENMVYAYKELISQIYLNLPEFLKIKNLNEINENIYNELKYDELSSNDLIVYDNEINEIKIPQTDALILIITTGSGARQIIDEAIKNEKEYSSKWVMTRTNYVELGYDEDWILDLFKLMNQNMITTLAEADLIQI